MSDQHAPDAPVETAPEGSAAPAQSDEQQFIESSADDRGYRNVREMQNAEGPIRYRMPDVTMKEMFAVADELLGASKLIVMCEDGKSRMARIPGKMKRRMWIKPGDLIIVKPWDFQDDKADVKYRYIKVQSSNLSKRGLIPDLLDNGFS